MAGVDHAGIVRSLKSAGDEKPLPCARSLAAQGFCPGDVSSWGENGGIPEDAAPFIVADYEVSWILFAHGTPGFPQTPRASWPE